MRISILVGLATFNAYKNIHSTRSLNDHMSIRSYIHRQICAYISGTHAKSFISTRTNPRYLCPCVRDLRSMHFGSHIPPQDRASRPDVLNLGFSSLDSRTLHSKQSTAQKISCSFLTFSNFHFEIPPNHRIGNINKLS